MDIEPVFNRQKPDRPQYIQPKKRVCDSGGRYGVVASPKDFQEKSGSGLHAHELGFWLVFTYHGWSHRSMQLLPQFFCSNL
jgi:hypothetical protein